MPSSLCHGLAECPLSQKVVYYLIFCFQRVTTWQQGTSTLKFKAQLCPS